MAGRFRRLTPAPIVRASDGNLSGTAARGSIYPRKVARRSVAGCSKCCGSRPSTRAKRGSLRAALCYEVVR